MKGVTQFDVIRDDNNKSIGVNLKYKNSEDTCDAGQAMSLDLTVHCDKDMPRRETRDFQLVKEQDCTYYIELYSKSGCPEFDGSYVLQFLFK